MQKVREQVMRILEEYPDIQRKVALLRYELAHPSLASADEMIESMTFAKHEGISQMKGHISNKTLYIALNYQEQMEQANMDVIDDVSEKLVELERIVDRLHYCVSLLEDRQAQVIRLYHFERKTWEEIADNMELSVRTVQKTKSAAVDKLVEMYCYVHNIGKT